jgi:hypothetical protein
VRHLRKLSQRPSLAQDDNADINFIIATLELALTILEAMQTKKLSQAPDVA